MQVQFISRKSKSQIKRILCIMTTLCQICASFSFKELYREEYSHQPSFKALKASAVAGCPLCEIFFSCLAEEIYQACDNEDKSLLDEPNSQVTVEVWPSEMDKIFGGKEKLRVRVGNQQRLLRAFVGISTLFGMSLFT